MDSKLGIHYLLLKECEPLLRESRFSYQCHQCNQCCMSNRIRVNPYEVLRLARYFKLSTNEFIKLYTRRSGIELAVNANNHCIFLSERGCSVYPERPLVCRLYPLSRAHGSDGKESFLILEPHPETKGCYGTKDSIRNFLSSHEADEFIAVMDRYMELFSKANLILERRASDDPARLLSRASRQAPLLGPFPKHWMDLDAMLSAHCDAQNMPVPEGLEAKIELHLSLIEQELKRLELEPRNVT